MVIVAAAGGGVVGRGSCGGLGGRVGLGVAAGSVGAGGVLIAGGVVAAGGVVIGGRMGDGSGLAALAVADLAGDADEVTTVRAGVAAQAPSTSSAPTAQAKVAMILFITRPFDKGHPHAARFSNGDVDGARRTVTGV